MRRLPEALEGDLASAALRAQTAEEAASGGDASREDLLTAGRAYEALSRHSQSAEHRRAAMRYYARFIQAVTSAASGADVVLYALGFLLVEDGQPDRARQMLHRLVRDHPHSPLVTRAYMLFGDQAADDPGAALMFYERAHERAQETGEAALRTYLAYRSAWMHRALSDPAAAREAFVRARRGARIPGLAAALRREACAFR